MTFENWREAVNSLEEYAGPVTPEQERLASQIGIDLDPELPALVAAERLKRGLKEALRVDDEGPPTFGQREFLKDLANELGEAMPSDIATRSDASAWILVWDARRTIQALRRLRLKRGDVVEIPGGNREIEMVASIGADGSVYFRGGGGRRAKAHRLQLLASAGSKSKEAELLRREAETRRAHLTRDTGPPSARRLATLAEYRVDALAPAGEAVRLESILEDAEDERPLQQLLTDAPEILASLVRGSYGRFVMPLPRLGSQYIPDFAIAAADSAGIHWTVVELESPRAEASTLKGRPAHKLRQAIDQVTDWRDWLERNVDYARRARDEEGLGLTDIRADADALILIGRAQEYHFKFNRYRHRLEREQRTLIHTYSWLVETLRFYGSPLIRPLETRNEGW